MNDVYFCARDAIRLLGHVDADLACSMDFLQWKDPPSTVDVYPYGVDGPPLSVSGPLNSVCLLFLEALSMRQCLMLPRPVHVEPLLTDYCQPAGQVCAAIPSNYIAKSFRPLLSVCN